MSSTPSPGDKKNIVKMAYIYFQEGRWDKAIEEYKKLLQIDPGDINTHNMLGDVYVKKGSHREAFEAYSKVSSEFSSHGQTDKAAIVNKKIAALDTGALSAEGQKKQHLIRQAIKAESAMEQGNVDEAIEALNEVSKLDSENLGAYSKLGELLEKKGKIPEAIQQYQVLGAVFLKNRLFKKAQEIFQRVTQLDPNNQEAHNNLAQIFVKQGSESDAKKEFLVAAELAIASGDLDKADSYASKAVEFKSIEAHYILGMVYFKRQKMSEAKNEFESLLRFKVNHVGALTHLGRVFLELNQSDKAAEQIQKALKIEKDNPVALEGMVELCLKKGNKAEAATNLLILIDKLAVKDELVKACEFAANLVSIDENNPAHHMKLADLLARSGNKVEAAEAYFKGALVQEKAGKKEQEMELLRKALELNPGHPGAQRKVMGEVTQGAGAQPPQSAPVPPVPAAPPAAAPANASTIGKIPAAGILDLDDEMKGPPPMPKLSAPTVAPEKPKAAAAPVPAAEAPGDDLKSQMSIAESYVSQGLVQEAIEIYQQLSEAHPENAELKKKLNQAYTAYVKTGDEVLGVLEREKKAKEEEEKKVKHEMELKAEEAKRQEAEKEAKARVEAERKSREEAEYRAKAEADRVHEEAERRVREENAKKNQEDAYRRAKEEAESRVREELQKKAEEDAKRKTAAEPRPSPSTPPSKSESLEEHRDEFMTIAVADIYVRQGLKEEALKIYRRIVQADPGNLEAKKKLADLEAAMQSSAPKAEPPAQPAPKPHSPHDGDKDSGGKKRSSRVGYV